jgi:aspartate racemase
MTLHIGIVGCSAEGASLCYRTICIEGAQLLGQHAHPEVSMHTQSLAKYVDCLNRQDIQGIADLMLQSAQKLTDMGADFMICPDNTIHQAFGLVEPNSPRPWLHIAATVAEEAVSRGFKRVGLIGTHWLVESNVYPDQLLSRGLEFARPSNAERQEVHRIIVKELVTGVIVPGSVEYIRRVIEGLAGQDCDSVVLGCTEIPLIISDENSSLPTLDSTRLLARAALRRALEGEKRT